MERLTEHALAEKLRKQVESEYTAPELVEGYTSYIKLSAYEDTGLEPADIEKLKADCKELEKLKKTAKRLRGRWRSVRKMAMGEVIKAWNRRSDNE